MHAILQAIAGPCAGARIIVRRGQIAQVGRTAWADFSFPGDAAMADVHFAVAHDAQGCRVRELKNAGILVNGEQVAESVLHTGDQVTAGQTTFAVLVEGEAPPAAPAADDGAEAPAGPPADSAAAYCVYIELSEPAQQLLQPTLAPAAFLELLTAQELPADAVRFLAAWLPKPEAVAWGAECVAGVCAAQLSPLDQEALDRARQWAAEPSEEHRRAAGAAAQAAKMSGPASWVAQAAFWSGGSLAPPDLPAVPPGPGLTAQAISAALFMTAPWGNPAQAPARYQMFLTHGRRRTVPK